MQAVKRESERGAGVWLNVGLIFLLNFIMVLVIMHTSYV